MSDREVMKLALAALESCDEDRDWEGTKLLTYDERLVAEAVAALRAELETPAASAWIACSDRMPPDGVEVLVFVGPSLYVAERDTDGWWAVDGAGCMIGGPTHWMPLPLPPEKPADPEVSGASSQAAGLSSTS
jgi:hypothetical protein